MREKQLIKFKNMSDSYEKKKYAIEMKNLIDREIIIENKYKLKW